MCNLAQLPYDSNMASIIARLYVQNLRNYVGIISEIRGTI